MRTGGLFDRLADILLASVIIESDRVVPCMELRMALSRWRAYARGLGVEGCYPMFLGPSDAQKVSKRVFSIDKNNYIPLYVCEKAVERAGRRRLRGGKSPRMKRHCCSVDRTVVSGMYDNILYSILSL